MNESIYNLVPVASSPKAKAQKHISSHDHSSTKVPGSTFGNALESYVYFLLLSNYFARSQVALEQRDCMVLVRL
jgi:hypothetical protein